MEKIDRNILDFAETVWLNRGRAYFVGGTVRDRILGMPVKDIDIEVHGIEPRALRQIVSSHFKDVKEVGVAFGVLSTHIDNLGIDISIPRQDSKVGAGHKGFNVNVNPHLSIEEALRRRDFTVNAMLEDILDGTIYDPFGGRADLDARILKFVDSDTFTDDPLRVLRGVQLAGRLEMTVDSNTSKAMVMMVDQLDELSIDRKRTEWQKLWLRAKKPSVGLNLAMDIGMMDKELQIFKKLKETPQDKAWHPEGNVWNHTAWVVDEAAKISTREKLDTKQRMMVMLSALCHDLGKPETTSELEDGHIHARGHDRAGSKYVARILEEMGLEKYRVAVERLVESHMVPPKLFRKRGEVTVGMLRKLARKVKPATLMLLAYLAEADRRGRGPFLEGGAVCDMSFVSWFIDEAKKANVHDKAPTDIIKGGDLIKLGFESGPHLGSMIRAANELFDEHELSREDILKAFEATREISSLSDHEIVAEILTGD